MTAPASKSATAFLRRAVLLAGILAVIAGIFGMHLMTGSHSMPMAASGADAAMLQDPGTAGHTGHPAGSTAALETPEAAGTSPLGTSCGATCGCTAMSAMDAACVPSVGNTSLAAPAPGTSPFGAHDAGAAAAGTIRHSYLPASPSPGELSISRT